MGFWAWFLLLKDKQAFITMLYVPISAFHLITSWDVAVFKSSEGADYKHYSRSRYDAV